MKNHSNLLILLFPIFLNSLFYQENFKPKISKVELEAPSDLVVSCQYYLDLDSLKSNSIDYLGTLYTEKKSQYDILIKDIVCRNFCKNDPQTKYPGINEPVGIKACALFDLYFDTAHFEHQFILNYGENGYYKGFDSFNIQLIDLRKCGQGLIQRVFEGMINGTVMSRDTQYIWVVKCYDLNINIKNLCDPNDDLEWKKPYCDSNYIYRLNDCTSKIDSNSLPKLKNTNSCNLISVEYRDEFTTGINSACFRIRRTWVLIDWCTYDPLSGNTKGRWEFIQTIEVNDPIIPSVVAKIGTSEPPKEKKDSCHSYIHLSVNTTDNCTPEDFLTFEYKIDINNDTQGKYSGFDLYVGKKSKHEFKTDSTLQYKDNPYASTISPFDASGDYPIGLHKICWYVTDGCNNTSTVCELFEVNDVEPPQILPIKNRTFNINNSGCIQISVKDLLLEAKDNCTETTNLKYYFNNDDSLLTKTVCCADIVKQNNCVREYHETFQINIEDESGNITTDTVKIVVLDELDICPWSTNEIKFSPINILTIDSNQINDVKVYTKAAKEYFAGTIKCRRNYEGNLCQNLPLRFQHESYYGLDVLDVILTNDFIQGNVNLTPFQINIADINKSNSISATDIKEITSKILDRSIRNWNFYSISDSLPLAPNFTCPDSCTILGAMEGDVSLDALSGCGDSLPPIFSCFKFYILDHQLFPGTEYEIPIYSNEDISLKGFQFDLFNKERNFNIENLTTANPDLKLVYSTMTTEDSTIRIIGYADKGNKPQGGIPIFNIILSVNKTIRTLELFNLNNQLLENAVYTNAYKKYSSCLEIIPVSNKDQEHTDEISITPNPTEGKILIHNVPEPDSKIIVYNSQGKLIKCQVNKFSESKTVEVLFENKCGIYFINIHTSKRKYVKKIICMN
ncbi:MAG: T9SS type A sorting domain-containing protein [Saprospiraceae bacterium]|nr:T9SS type A sorting domain-containing protein [Saprospiraceae bacterium]